MKPTFEDYIMLFGLAALSTGVWLQFGAGWSLIVVGVTLMAGAVLIARR